MWSLGNESYVGDVLEEMNRLYKEWDPDRLVHYESVIYNRDYEDTVSDIECRMYAPPEAVRAYLDKDPKKPFVLSEFMHCMGNSVGGLVSYMDLLDEHEMYQGGFIWDFIDQALFVTDEVTGKKVLRYGADFDERPADYEFSGDGIVFADRREKPAVQEVRYLYGKYRCKTADYLWGCHTGSERRGFPLYLFICHGRAGVSACGRKGMAVPDAETYILACGDRQRQGKRFSAALWYVAVR